MKYILLICLLYLSVGYAHCQVIQPQDLYTINTVWQGNSSNADREAYKTIKAVDPNWTLTGKPTTDDKGFLAIYGYTKDRKDWYKPGVCVLTLQTQGGRSKSILYQFTEKATWDIYRNQIDGMHPAVLGGGGTNGGNNVMYAVNGLIITMTDFPPGVKDSERVYQIIVEKGG